MPNPAHVSEKDLVRYRDREMQKDTTAAIEMHLQHCLECRSRLEKLKIAANAYTEYHENVLKASLDSQREWPRLDFSAAESQTRRSRRGFSLLWATVPAVLCGLAVFALFFYRQAPQRKMSRLLAHAAAAPTSPHERLRVIWKGQTWYRAAVLRKQPGTAIPEAQHPALAYTRTLFVKANYSWDDPLSARSFAAWRNQLRDKRDQVFSFDGEDGNSRFYRLRTDTSQGLLRTASLTLRADTFHPVEGRFRFEHEDDLMMVDSGEMPAAAPTAAAQTPVRQKAAVETRVTPEDELRVFAALNAISADAGEPLTVEVDATREHVVVNGVGIPDNRQREIRNALATIPNATTHFGIGQPPTGIKQSPDTGVYSPAVSAPLRHGLETKAGGSQEFQQIADRALDASSLLVAHAHALATLAQTFPPSVQVTFAAADEAKLRFLRHRHAIAIEQAVLAVREALAPLLDSQANKETEPSETAKAPDSSWQSGAAPLLELCQQLDGSLSRLLAGSYSQQDGEDILSRLPDEIKNLEKLARKQEIAP